MVAMPPTTTTTTTGGGTNGRSSPPLTSIHVSVESAGEGCHLLVLRGGLGSFASSASNVRLANHTAQVVSVRQVAKPPGWQAEGPWFAVEAGSSQPWALSNPLRSAAASGSKAAAAATKTKTKTKKRTNKKPAFTESHQEGGDDEDVEEDEDLMEEDDGVLVGFPSEADAAADPVYVEIVVGRPVYSHDTFFAQLKA